MIVSSRYCRIVFVFRLLAWLINTRLIRIVGIIVGLAFRRNILLHFSKILITCSGLIIIYGLLIAFALLLALSLTKLHHLLLPFPIELLSKANERRLGRGRYDVGACFRVLRLLARQLVQRGLYLPITIVNDLIHVAHKVLKLAPFFGKVAHVLLHNSLRRLQVVFVHVEHALQIRDLVLNVLGGGA